MSTTLHRHDISDQAWELIAPHLPGQAGQWGGIAADNRRFVNAVFWILRTGAPWRDLPPSYGNWNSVAKRFRRWVSDGVWEQVLEALIDEPDYEWLMIAKVKHFFPKSGRQNFPRFGREFFPVGTRLGASGR